MASIRNSKARLALKVLLIAAALTQFAAGAYAQKMGGRAGKSGSPENAAGIEKKQKARAIDEAYRATLNTIPNKPKADPWGGMR
jgi:hypothetical protein